MSSLLPVPSAQHLYTPLNVPAHRRLGSQSRILRHALVFSVLTILILAFSAYTNLRTGDEQSMRLCIPVDLNKVSQTGHKAFSCLKGAKEGINGTYSTMDEVSKSSDGDVIQPGRLADFLALQKETFLDDLKRGKFDNWTFAMGNEAGDLDSLASSIAYATLGTLLQKKRSIPLILTPSNLVNLRPENQLALSLSQVPSSSLLYIDQLPIPPSELAGLGIKFALVDHNSLLSQFHSSETEKHDPVVAIIDHHVDEQKHMSASPRIIQVPTGSTSSLVAMQFAPEWTASLSEDTVPAELATLLLTAGLIDTGGLKAGESSKTTATDRQAGELLWKISGETVQGMFPAASGGATFTEASVSQESLEEGKIPDALQTLTKELLTAKFDVTNLSSRELLMRDYKEYTMSTSLEGKEVQVGLSTVPMGLGPWLSRERDNDEGWEGLLEAIDDWMLERGLDVEGILTTFREAASEDRERGKGRREILLVVRTSKDSVLSQEEAARLFKKLQSEMIAADEVLELKSWPGKKAGATLRKELKDLSLVRGDGSAQVDRWGDVWRQGNTGSTRKQVQPLIKDIIGSFA